jgi:hypothetical protein
VILSMTPCSLVEPLQFRRTRVRVSIRTDAREGKRFGPGINECLMRSTVVATSINILIRPG